MTMNQPPDPRAEVLELCDRLFDGDFSQADRDRLEILVIGNTINFGTSGGTPGQETANTGARRSGRLSWREIIRD